jgi:(2Fe-2S) ferredoxin
MYYKKHLFICTNQKEAGKQCCQQAGAEEMVRVAKETLKEHHQQGPGLCRVSKSGCLGRCSEGPVAVVYPDGVWYTYHSSEDVKKIVTEHLINDRIVKELVLHS